MDFIQQYYDSFREFLRRQFPGKPRSPFKSEQEAYEFCERAYRESGGISPELKRAYEFYQTNYNDDCPPTAGHSLR